MSETLETAFSHLGTILRYVAPGFVALFVLMFAAHKPPFDLFKYGGPWVAVGAVLSGILIHTIHTALLVRIFLWCLVALQLLKAHRFIPEPYSSMPFPDRLRFPHTTIFNVVWNLETDFVIRQASAVPEVKAIYEMLAKWTANVHFLYCTSYCLILIPGCVSLIDRSGFNTLRICLILLGLVTLFCAFKSDYQLIKRHFWALKEYPRDKKANGQDSEA